jgi:Ras-related protein Rab-8A
MTSTGAYDQLIKLIIIGNTAVGKTSLVVRYCDGGFEPKTYLSTVGVDFKTKVVEIDGRSIKVQIWDTAGQERFKNITRAYYRGANGIILVYDVTSRETFDSIRTWFQDIKELSRGDQPLVLLANKSDKKKDQVVSNNEGEALAKELNADFFEVSAKIRYNVDEAFLCIATKGTKYKADSRDPSLLSGVENENASGGCC